MQYLLYFYAHLIFRHVHAGIHLDFVQHPILMHLYKNMNNSRLSPKINTNILSYRRLFSNPLLHVFSWLLIFTNIVLGVLLYFQFDKQLTIAWSERYQVPLRHLTQKIEYGVQLGFSLETMGNLPFLLANTVQRYPELSSISVINHHGLTVSHTPNYHEHQINMDDFLANANNKDKTSVVENVRINHSLIWAITNPFGNTIGAVLMDLPIAELDSILDTGKIKLTIGIVVILIVFLLVASIFFKVSCNNLEQNLDTLNSCADKLLLEQSHIAKSNLSETTNCSADLTHYLELAENFSTAHPKQRRIQLKYLNSLGFQTRILIGAMVLLLLSALATTSVGYLIFRDLYLPTLYSQSQIIGKSLADMVGDIHTHGIPLANMRGLNVVFADLIKQFPQIASIGLYNNYNKLVQFSKQPDTVDPPQTLLTNTTKKSGVVIIPIVDDIGAIELRKVPRFFAARLMDIALDVIALLIVSILIASELLVFVVRFVVAVPLNNLVSAMQGKSSIIEQKHGTEILLAINNLESKIRQLAILFKPHSKIHTNTVTATNKPRIVSSPLLSYVRPPLFLVVFADSLSISFFPLYVKTMAPEISWLPPKMVLGL
ncbi:hypothetical protein TI04_09235, partial [Achromatium sp. WMS2]